MRSTRALLLGAALSAALTLAAPAAAFADGMHDPDGQVSSHENDGHHDDADKHGDEDKDASSPEHDGRHDKHEEGDDDEMWHMHHPHGGIHAGGGGLSATDSNLVGGVALLLGGLGLGGAYVLRRRAANTLA